VLQKITVAECIETQSKAMTMLTIDQLSFLLKFALQKMKQPGVSSSFLGRPRGGGANPRPRPSLKTAGYTRFLFNSCLSQSYIKG